MDSGLWGGWWWWLWLAQGSSCCSPCCCLSCRSTCCCQASGVKSELRCHWPWDGGSTGPFASEPSELVFDSCSFGGGHGGSWSRGPFSSASYGARTWKYVGYNMVACFIIATTGQLFMTRLFLQEEKKNDTHSLQHQNQQLWAFFGMGLQEFPV